MCSTNDKTLLTQTELTCDYLIVGAGTACLSFVDTLLDLRKDFSFIIVDRNSAPGGHWTKAYPHVALHQPSAAYGVRSLPLGKLDKYGKELFDLNDRATGNEVCKYYEKAVENFKATGRMRTYFNANYVGELSHDSGNNYNDPTAKITHTITTEKGETLHIKCRKVVKCETSVVIPSMRQGVPFPIEESAVKTITPNELPEKVGNSEQKYMVVGAGKTGVDALIYLLDEAKVHPDQITWVVSRTVWYWIRDAMWPKPKPGAQYYANITKHLFEPLLKAKSTTEYFSLLEKLEIIARVDPHDGHSTTIFKGATITFSELALLRSIKHVIKNKGRITSITSNEVIFQDGKHSIPFTSSDTLLVDCMADHNYGYFNFEEDFEFFNPREIRLGPLTSILNPSHSSTQIAFLEAEFSDTQEGDAVKNSFCFFLRGKLQTEYDFQQMFVLSLYAQMKTDEQLMKYRPYSTFVLGDRTDMNQPDHHGGLFGVLWSMFGPLRMKHKADTLLKKLDTGGLEDFPPNPLPGQKGTDPSKFEAAKRPKPMVSSGETNGNEKHSSSKTGKKKWLDGVLCCKSNGAVHSSIHNYFLQQTNK